MDCFNCNGFNYACVFSFLISAEMNLFVTPSVGVWSLGLGAQGGVQNWEEWQNKTRVLKFTWRLGQGCQVMPPTHTPPGAPPSVLLFKREQNLERLSVQF